MLGVGARATGVWFAPLALVICAVAFWKGHRRVRPYLAAVAGEVRPYLAAVAGARQEARDFLDFLASPTAGAVFAKYGFTILNK